ncbi:unnamed protein product [Moneuplotes crassus]|uniref:Hexose transporter 1 n=1 Tax=Euplotes crassus TaxID=5936 RepID=A0AAD1X4A5_EUPCR|nr:unnamed protein product [Moneuplotes crassus]
MSKLSYSALWSCALAIGHFQFWYLVNTTVQLWGFSPCIYGFDPKNARAINLSANGIFLIMTAIGGGFSWKLSRYGKRKALIISAILCFFGSFILYIGSIYAMIIGRIIIGLGLGITSTVAPLFINEISSPKYKECCIVTIQFWYRFGLLISLLLNFLLPNADDFDLNQGNDASSITKTSLILLFYTKMPANKISENCAYYSEIDIRWREFMIPITLVPVIQILLLLLIFKRENPAYAKDCENSFTSIGSCDSTDNLARSAINYEEELQQSSAKEITLLEIDTWENLWKYPERKKIIASLIIKGFQQLIGINLVLNYGLSFVYDSRFPNINLSFTLICASFLFMIPSIFMLKKFGRKNLLLAALIIACFCCCILFQLTDSLTLVNDNVPIFESMVNLSSAIFIWVYSISFTLNFSSTPILYCAETLTDKGMSIVMAFQWAIIAFMTSLPSIVMEVVERIQGRASFRMVNSFLFFIFSGASMLGFFCAFLYVVETKGKSKKQLSKDFRKDMFCFQNSLLRSGFKE